MLSVRSFWFSILYFQSSHFSIPPLRPSVLVDVICETLRMSTFKILHIFYDILQTLHMFPCYPGDSSYFSLLSFRSSLIVFDAVFRSLIYFDAIFKVFHIFLCYRWDPACFLWYLSDASYFCMWSLRSCIFPMLSLRSFIFFDVTFGILHNFLWDPSDPSYASMISLSREPPWSQSFLQRFWIRILHSWKRNSLWITTYSCGYFCIFCNFLNY